MSTGYETTGRVPQKERTRNALIVATRDLLKRQGHAPTVEAVAAAASISRTTAYRYFPNQASLLAAAHPEVDVVSLLPAGTGDDPATRLGAVVKAFLDIVLDTEPQLRTMLRLSLETAEPRVDSPLRKGRAIAWFEDALSPLLLELGAAGIRDLAIAIRSATGIESLVWLTDIGGLSHEHAVKFMQWSAQALLQHALLSGLPRTRASSVARRSPANPQAASRTARPIR